MKKFLILIFILFCIPVCSQNFNGRINEDSNKCMEIKKSPEVRCFISLRDNNIVNPYNCKIKYVADYMKGTEIQLEGVDSSFISENAYIKTAENKYNFICFQQIDSLVCIFFDKLNIKEFDFDLIINPEKEEYNFKNVQLPTKRKKN